MAIEPSKARELTKEDSDLVKLSEEQIDNSIVKQIRYGPIGYGALKVEFSLREELSNPARRILKRHYEGAGWNVVNNIVMLEDPQKAEDKGYTYNIVLKERNKGEQQ